MNILLFNVHLYGYGGSELWTHTMYHQLKKDHNVSVYTKYPGIISAQLNTVTKPPKDIDVIIGAHWVHMKKEGLHKLAPIILVSHSFFLEVERFERGAAKYVAISDEIARIRKKYNPTVIYNPIDFKVYRPIKPPRKRLTKVLYLSHGGRKADNIIKEACEEYGVEYLQFDKRRIDLSGYINEADMCIGIGRCAIEAMACGRSVIIGDWRNYQQEFSGSGLLMPDELDACRGHNYTGRHNPKALTKQDLINYFEMYLADTSYVDAVKRHHDVEVVAEQFMGVYAQIPN